MPRLWIERGEDRDGRPVLRLAGALCGAGLSLLEGECAALLDGPVLPVLDLSRLTYLSCEGARVLNGFAAAGARLAAAPPLISEVLDDDRDCDQGPDIS